MQALWQRHELCRELVDAVVRVGAPEGDADEQLDKLVEDEPLIDLIVALAAAPDDAFRLLSLRPFTFAPPPSPSAAAAFTSGFASALCAK